jgi:hypothetical protein
MNPMKQNTTLKAIIYSACQKCSFLLREPEVFLRFSDCKSLVPLLSQMKRIRVFLPHCYLVALGGLVVSVLAIGPKVRGFDPDRGRWIFKGDKNQEHHFLRRGSKAVGPMS